ncbi:MAG: Stress responsive A/B Barrel Domain protein [Bacteroidetes bacterium ADurb.Bin302]|nr:MAG: Stress responsive A/B Barrel Domain protein [Bacteroidetes bacterium ADurb.Bin302]
MIRHLVMWKLKANAEGKTKAENAHLTKQNLENLSGLIPCLKSIHVGINLDASSPSNYDVVLDTSFENLADLDAYQVHEAHIRVAGYIKRIVDDRVCVDYEF